MSGPLRRLVDVLRAERGFALVLALGMLVVLSIVATAAIDYSSSSARSSSYSSASQKSYALAESGINDALAQLYQAFQPATSTALPSSSSPTTVTTSTGSYTWYGTLTGTTWLLTSTGLVRNPTGPGASAVRRKVTRSVDIQGLNSGSNNSAWSRIYNDDTTACFTIPTGIEIPANVGTRGSLCLNGAAITGAASSVAVGTTVTSVPDSTANTSVLPAGAGAGWTTPGNIVASDNVKATAAVASGANSANLDATSFGFTLPSNASISGISVKVERGSSATNSFKDNGVQLLKAGTPVGNNKAGTTYWGTGDTNITYGAANDLWGTTWTPADIDSSTFGLRFSSHNYAVASQTASVDYVEITITYTTDASIGTSSVSVAHADIGGTCKWSTQATHTPCTSTDHVWATASSTSPSGLSKPTVDFAYWYQNAAPGPKHGCDVSTGTPPVFDNNTTYDGGAPDAWVAPDPTPKDDPASTNGGTTGNTSYTCQAKNAQGAVIGELSWNNATRVLTIKGTIFFDGQMLFHNHNGYVVHYQGKATIYASGGWHNDEAVCAGGSGLTTCRTPAAIANWDPTQNMMVLILGDKNAAGNDDCSFHTDYSAFQGVLWAKNNCAIKDTAYSSGPVIAQKVLITGTPYFGGWPPLGSLLPGQTYGSTSSSTDFLISPGSQSG
jgi:Tfp pilus assembly protein PilX